MTEQKLITPNSNINEQSHPAKYAFLVAEKANMYSCLTFYTDEVAPTVSEDVFVATHFQTLTDLILACHKHGIIFYGDERDTHDIELVLNHQFLTLETTDDDIDYERFPLRQHTDFIFEMRREYDAQQKN